MASARRSIRFSQRQARDKLRAQRKLGRRRTKSPKVPRQLPPTGVTRDYARVLLKMIATVENALAPLMLAVKRFKHDQRMDAGEVEQTKALLKAARAKLKGNPFVQADMEAITKRIASGTEKWQRRQLLKQLHAVVGADVLLPNAPITKHINGFMKTNVALIKNIPEKIIGDVSTTVINGVNAGRRSAHIARDIQEKLNIGKRRAKLIARDQVGTLYSEITAERHKAIGVKKFAWRTAGDERVRPEHAAIADNIYEYDKPPHGELPGFPINCRCYPDPVFDFLSKPAEELEPKEVKPKRKPKPAPPVVTRAPERASTVSPTQLNQMSASFDTKVSTSQRQAIAAYTDGPNGPAGAFELNASLVEKNALSALQKETIKHLDEAIASFEAPRDMKVFRGIALDSETVLTKGSRIESAGYTSTSASSETASSYTEAHDRGALMEISIGKGQKIGPVADISRTANGWEEQELLLGRGSKLEIVSVHTDADGLEIIRAVRVQ